MKSTRYETSYLTVKSVCPACGYNGVHQIENEVQEIVECFLCEKKYIVKKQVNYNGDNPCCYCRGNGFTHGCICTGCRGTGEAIEFKEIIP